MSKKLIQRFQSGRCGHFATSAGIVPLHTNKQHQLAYLQTCAALLSRVWPRLRDHATLPRPRDHANLTTRSSGTMQ
eukprot:2805532-Pleurochrysis_carterae.AAC.1